MVHLGILGCWMLTPVFASVVTGPSSVSQVSLCFSLIGRGRPRRAIAPLLPPAALPEGGCERTAAAEARPEVRAAPRRRDPPEGRDAGAPCRRGCTLGSRSGQGRGDEAAAAERPQPWPGGAGSPLPGGVAGRLSVHPPAFLRLAIGGGRRGCPLSGQAKPSLSQFPGS